MTSPDPRVAGALGQRQVHRAMRATYVAFAGSGVAMASWISRIPQFRDHLHLAPSALGLILLCVAAGSIVALPLSGPVIARVGSRQVVTVTAAMVGVALTALGLSYLLGVVAVAASLLLFGLAAGTWDVAMNVHGALVEQHLGRSVMSRFHAVFSLGTVAGALLGVAMVAANVPVAVHLTAIALILATVVVVMSRQFLTYDRSSPEQDLAESAIADATRAERGTRCELPDANPGAAPRGAFQSWTEPRTLLLGVFVLAFAFAEGVGNDWIAVAVIDGHRTAQAIGTLAYATFLTAMTAGRWAGPVLLDRYGRAPVVRALAILAIIGTALFVLGPGTPVAFAGAVLWGLGASLGFPVGMSAGADDPALAAGRVSVISSIGYCAFLAGPPLIGMLADHVTVLRAVAAVVGPMAVAALIAPVVQARSARPGPSRAPVAPPRGL